jgi:hypothetical protein
MTGSGIQGGRPASGAGVLSENSIQGLGSACEAEIPGATCGRHRDRLLNETNKQGEKTEVEGTPVKEVAPAKMAVRQ